MTNVAIVGLRVVMIGAVVFCVAGPENAAAETVVYRFVAERQGIPVEPPAGSVAAMAATLPRLSGTFGFESDSPVASEATIPGRVAFGSYDTGFVTIDAAEIGPVPGVVSVQVTDGVTRTDDPLMTISDEISLSTRAISVDAPVDALTLRLRYLDAERLQSVDLPEMLILADLAETRLTFSTRIDGMSDRAEGNSAAVDLLAVVHFDITLIERVE